MTWQPIETAPKDGTTVLVKLSCGGTAIAEWWTPPPIELDPEQTCQGWALSPVADLWVGTELGEPTEWQPMPVVSDYPPAPPI